VERYIDMKDLAKKILNEDKRLQHFILSLRGKNMGGYGRKVDGQLMVIKHNEVVMLVKNKYNQTTVTVQFDNILDIRQ